MPILPREPFGRRIGGKAEGNVYLNERTGRVTKKIKEGWLIPAYRGMTIAEQKVRFAAHRVGFLLFPKHVLNLHFAGTTKKGVFTVSKFKPSAPMPPHFEPMVRNTRQRLLGAGVKCDFGPETERNYALRGGEVFFFEVTRLFPAIVNAHLENRSDLNERKKEEVRKWVAKYQEEWKKYAAAVRKAGLGRKGK